MRLNATYKLTWDRKNKGGKQAVQIEILFPDRSRKYIGTGIRLTADQSDPVNRQVKNTVIAAELNRGFTIKPSQLNMTS